MSVTDLATWVAWHLKGLNGMLPTTSPINQAAFIALHTPWNASSDEDDADYALGCECFVLFCICFVFVSQHRFLRFTLQGLIARGASWTMMEPSEVRRMTAESAMIQVIVPSPCLCRLPYLHDRLRKL